MHSALLAAAPLADGPAKMPLAKRTSLFSPLLTIEVTNAKECIHVRQFTTRTSLMKKTRLSLFYLAGYLIPSGLVLMFAPTPALRLLRSTGQYGDVMPR